MQFTLIPADGSSLSEQVIYAFETNVPTSFDVKIIDGESQTVVGVKRFTETTAGRINIAPYLRRLVEYAPTVGVTGFLPTSHRTVCAIVEIGTLRTPARIFTASVQTLNSPALLTSLPDNRYIAQGESEELTLWTQHPCNITVVAQRSGVTEGQSYTAPQSGFTLFRLNTNDFAGAETITLSIGNFRQIVYTLIHQPHTAHRLAWRSRAGSIEHYTFPVEKEAVVTVDKQKTETADGYLDTNITQETTLTLLSAYESATMIDALAEVIYSPEVWLLKDTEYVPIDLPKQQTILRHHGTLRYLEVTLRPKTKTVVR
ncbi:MAG: hypothetical protein RR960_01900 [Alistipes sp.]